MACRIILPTPRDLKDPDGWRLSNFRKMRHPAVLERWVDSISGVRRHGWVRVFCFDMVGDVRGSIDPIFSGVGSETCDIVR